VDDDPFRGKKATIKTCKIIFEKNKQAKHLRRVAKIEAAAEKIGGTFDFRC
jgi:hypothetical protein